MQQLEKEREREREVMAANVNDEEYDRMKEVKQFDESKIGVKGLVDSGITAIPRFFVHPPDVLSQFKPGSKTRPDLVIPTIDLSGVDSHHNRSLIVDQIRQACSSFGFFQIIIMVCPREFWTVRLNQSKGSTRNQRRLRRGSILEG